MKTIAQAVAYLVAQGKPANFALAAMNEQYCGDDAGGTLYDINFGSIEQSEEDVMMSYNTHANLMVKTEDGIEFDGELNFDCDGNFLPR